jgi:Zn-dependent protease with chaperone function
MLGGLERWMFSKGRQSASIVYSPAAIFAKLLRAIVRHVPTARAALVLVLMVGVIAAVQLAQHHAWLALAMLIGLALVVAVQPLAQPALSRASERAADDYTAQLGSGPDLAAALQRGQLTDRTRDGSLSVRG